MGSLFVVGQMCAAGWTWRETGQM